MIVGYHIIFGAYGFWLPNDPRGSWSETVRSWELFRYGAATKTTERRSVAHQPHDHARRLAAKAALKYPAVQFAGLQARAVGRGFAEDCHRANVTVWACAILPDHVHIVTSRLHIKAEQFAIQLKGAATRKLIEEKLHPLQSFCAAGERPPRCFAQGGVEGVPRSRRCAALHSLCRAQPRKRRQAAAALELHYSFHGLNTPRFASPRSGEFSGRGSPLVTVKQNCSWLGS